MPQTLMALLAMMTVTLASINQQRTLVETQRAMLDDEMEIMASGIALQAIEYIQTKSFDSATIAARVTDAQDLSSNFPTGNRCPLRAADEGAYGYDDCDDLSDYNDADWEVVPFTIGGETIEFEVKAEVAYVDESQSRIYGTSFNKEVVVTVRESRNDGTRSLLRQPITVARTISY